ncbi:MAG: hypothetical protein Q4G40_11785 [Brachybacterium sp.]|nr:hypothetical protein [Brachybacterium sp.]
MPLPLLVVILGLAAAMGLLLAYSLQLATGTPVGSGSDATVNGRHTVSGAPVLDESTLGDEVQLLVETGGMNAPATFDVAQCLAEQDITEPVVAMEEMQWGPELEPGWLIIHDDRTPQEVLTDGGPVAVTLVRETCGTSPDGDAADTRLWAGSAMLYQTTP